MFLQYVGCLLSIWNHIVLQVFPSFSFPLSYPSILYSFYMFYFGLFLCCLPFWDILGKSYSYPSGKKKKNCWGQTDNVFLQWEEMWIFPMVAKAWQLLFCHFMLNIILSSWDVPKHFCILRNVRRKFRELYLIQIILFGEKWMLNRETSNGRWLELEIYQCFKVIIKEM